jgi:uncharacterized protein
MLISDRTIKLTACCLALLCGTQAKAFEIREGEAETKPESALQALPSPGISVPDLGLKKSMREGWHGFLQSYKSGDKAKARVILEKEAQSGDILALWKLGRMYADGDGGDVDHYKAFQQFSKIADTRGDESRDSPYASIISNALIAVGHYWSVGIPKSPVNANQAQAAHAFKHAASMYAHPEAQYQLARMLLDNSLGKPDPRMALRWLNLAAEKGHVQAQAVLGRMLYLGESTQRQTLTGLMWLHVARSQAEPTRDGWVLDMHSKAFAAASEEERMAVEKRAQRFLRQTAADRR